MKHWKRLAMVMAIGVLPFRVGAEEGVKDSAHVPVMKANEVTLEQRALPVDPMAIQYGSVMIRDVEKTSKYVHNITPEVFTKSAMAQERINKEIKNYVDKVEKEITKKNLKEAAPTHLYITYVVKDTPEGLLSIVLQVQKYQEGMAHGMNEEQGFTFNTTSGKKINLYDIGTYKLEDVKQAIANEIEDDAMMGKVSTYSIPEDLKVSKNFFLHAGNLYLIYETGTIAPYAEGVVHLYMEPYKMHQ